MTMVVEEEGEGVESNTDRSDTVAGDHHEKETKLSKRARAEISSSSLEVSSFLLIEEVLRRLPTSKAAFQCKCVCKNWYTLLSTPYFARRFITHKLHHLCNKSSSALVINCRNTHDDTSVFTVSDEPMFRSRRFELNFLLPDHRKYGQVEVLAIYKDLMLCSVESRVGERLRCCICNPFTMNWAVLPSLIYDIGKFKIQIGFVCEPYYLEDSNGECTLNSKYRFRVVHINEAKTNDNENKRFILWTYCSETQKWCKSVLLGSEYGSITDIVAYNGKLLWYNGSNIFAYDPFNPQLSTFIDCSYIKSTEIFSHLSYYCLGVCQGCLRMMQLVGRGTPKSLVVWELQDYDTMKWSLVEKFYLDTMIAESHILDASSQTSLAQVIAVGKKFLSPLGFHQTDRDIVYLHFKACVISCNVRTKELKVIGEIPCWGNFWRDGSVFHLELPLWPTPITELIEILPSW